MIIAALIIFSLAVAQLLVALGNVVFQPRQTRGEGQCASLTVVIPARNEEAHLEGLLHDLLTQDCGDFNIIVFDDDSEDDTAAVVSRMMEHSSRIRLIRSHGLPPGWLGKNHACHRASENVHTDYILFVDADVRLDENALSRALKLIRREQSALLSVFPSQETLSLGEKVTVPVMNYILLTLLPLVLVRHTKYPALSAANGQFMLFDTSVYHRLKPHQRFRSSMVEDIHIARFLKQEQLPVSCVTGIREIRCRMYAGFGDAIRGFSKNIFMFFGNSPLVAVAFWIITTLGFIPIFLSHWYILWALYAGVLLLTRVLVAIASRRSWLLALLTLIPEQFSMALMLAAAFKNRINKQYVWKSRTLV